MTRAKRALYLVVEPAPAKSTSQNFTRFLRDTLGENWTRGDPRWFEHTAPATGRVVEPVKPERMDRENEASAWNSRRLRRPARTPSAMKPSQVKGSLVFELGRNRAADFGSAVHERFAEIDWISNDGVETWASVWNERYGASEATEEALACLREPELGGIWLKPVGAGAVGLAMEVWRERTFELVLDGNWVTGIFDRVMVVRRADGQGVGATVVDFKTDRLETDFDWAKAAEKHSAQLNLYRRVVSILTGIPLNQVQCEIVFTRRRRRVPVSFQK
jgi:ATP-dependent helicase/nuclease subunit A